MDSLPGGQACLNDRGCVSFEVGVAGEVTGDCMLSYDTPKSVVAGLWSETKGWDYYELSTKQVNQR